MNREKLLELYKSMIYKKRCLQASALCNYYKDKVLKKYRQKKT